MQTLGLQKVSLAGYRVSDFLPRHYCVCILHINFNVCHITIYIFSDYYDMFLNFDNKKGLRFVYLNVRSYWNKFDQMRQLLLDSNISVLGVSESVLTHNLDQRSIEIPKYSCVRFYRNWSDDHVFYKKKSPPFRHIFQVSS